MDKATIPSDEELKIDVKYVEMIRQAQPKEYNNRLHELLLEGKAKNFTYRVKVGELVQSQPQPQLLFQPQPAISDLASTF